MFGIELEIKTKLLLLACGMGFIGFLLNSALPKQLTYHFPREGQDLSFSYEMPRSHVPLAPAVTDAGGLMPRKKIVAASSPESSPKSEAPAAKPATPPVTAKPAAAAAKPAVDKAKAAQIARQKALQQKQASEAAARKRLNVQVTNTQPWGKSVDDDEPVNPPVVAMPYFPPVANPDVNRNDKPQDDTDLTMDPSTWQALLQTHPTAENVSKFLQAHHQGKVADEVFYAIAGVLIQDRADDRRKAGLALLAGTPDIATFEYLVMKGPSFPADVQPQLKAILSSYSTTHIGILAQVLATEKNKQILIVALTLAQSAVAAVAASAQTTPGGLLTPAQPTGAHASPLKSALQAPLTSLGKNSDSQIASEAKTILAML
ncbi:MAG: hypothetical protein C5B49_11335 [Bdellovibrio sp.]|nr:MAG: hypothetical protein C5B49_11335 [Bdellovibrio sp.]